MLRANYLSTAEQVLFIYAKRIISLSKHYTNVNNYFLYYLYNQIISIVYRINIRHSQSFAF